VKVKKIEIMKKIAASLLALSIAVSALGAYKTMHKKKKKAVKQKAAAVVNNTNIKSVLMGRAACYGECPTYTIEVFETGLLRYTGKDHVEKKGIYEKQVSAAEAINFLKDFNTLRPDTLHYMYKTLIADLPGIYYFISYPDSVKKIINADAGPRILIDWAKKFDEFAKIDNSWKPQTEKK
jgi:hypothetical protein